MLTFPKPGASYKALGKAHRTGGPFRQYCGVCGGTGEASGPASAARAAVHADELFADAGE